MSQSQHGKNNLLIALAVVAILAFAYYSYTGGVTPNVAVVPASALPASTPVTSALSGKTTTAVALPPATPVAVPYTKTYGEYDGPSIGAIKCPVAGQKMTITKFLYSAPANGCAGADYTDAVQAQVSNGALNVNYPSQNTVATHDPCYGFHKTVDMAYTCS